MGSMRSLIGKAVGSAFKALGDIPKVVRYQHVNQFPRYDATTGDVVDSGGQLESQVIGVLLTPTSLEKFGTKRDLSRSPPTAPRVMIAQATDFKQVPMEGDRMWVDGTEEYSVLGLRSDPADATYEVLVERVGGGSVSP